MVRLSLLVLVLHFLSSYTEYTEVCSYYHIRAVVSEFFRSVFLAVLAFALLSKPILEEGPFLTFLHFWYGIYSTCPITPLFSLKKRVSNSWWTYLHTEPWVLAHQPCALFWIFPLLLTFWKVLSRSFLSEMCGPECQVDPDPAFFLIADPGLCCEFTAFLFLLPLFLFCWGPV